jgi:5'(3')-deoxyribonucleotidase
MIFLKGENSMMIYKEIGIDVDQLYEELDDSLQEELNIFLESYLLDNLVQPEDDKNYTKKQRDEALVSLISVAIEV